jgi:hypothetical protein
VVFWPATSQGGDKPGTIARATLHAAHTEAASIAADGGTAHVHYVTPEGNQQLITTYAPASNDPPRGARQLPRWAPPKAMLVAAPLVGIASMAAITVYSRRRPGPRR